MDKELLDDVTAVDDAELARSLKEVWHVNRYMGGNPALFRHIRQFMRQAPKHRAVRVLDVATGLADVSLALTEWSRRQVIPVEITGVDIHPRILRLAAERTAHVESIRIEHGDGRALAYPDGAFDIGFCNLALHHFVEDDAVLVLQELSRVCRLGWVVTDLERHPAAYAAAKLLAKLVWRSPVTRHDGPLSVRRAFTAGEAAQLIARANVKGNVKRHFPFRLALVGHE
ncbi:methyltransferase domain-containing protein [Paenibacillus aurantiacus]|uniref:Methyltransferase domain-containing protein n=1 Tax=Paenibacillus aurantiacus TaxID=1936118 RepID=A0ABV5KZ34_9BACL